MGNEIDRLEIVIESEASKANRSLSSMEKHLDKVAEGLEKVLLLANGGLSLDKMFKGVSSANTAEKFGQQMADSLIKGFNLNRAGSDVKRQVKSLSMDISKSLYSSGPNNKTTHDIERLGGIVKKHGTIAQEVSSDYKNLYDGIKAVSKIKIRPETASALGDNFKSRSGLLRTKMSTKSGIELDSIYQELRGKYPHILPDYSNVEDQFSAINNAVREYLSLKDKAFRPVTEDEAYEAVVDSVGDLNNKLKEAKTASDMVNSSMREMKSLSESFSFDASGMNEMKKVIDSALGGGKKKNTAPRIKRADLKYTEASLDDIFEKYKDVGTGIDLSGVGLPELEKMAQSADGSIKRLNERLVKKIAIEGTKDLGKTWESLIYDIQKATNEADAYGEAIDKIKKKRLDMSNLQINREKPPVRMKAVEKDRLPTINGAIFNKEEANEIKAVGNELNGVSEDAKKAIVNVSRLQSLVSSLKKNGYTIRAYPPEISSSTGAGSSFARDILDSFKLDENGQLSNLKNLGNVFKTYMSGISKSIRDGFKLNEDGTINGVEAAKRALSSFVSTAKNAFSAVRGVSLNSQLLNATEVVDWDRFFGLESLDKNIRKIENDISVVKNIINQSLPNRFNKSILDVQFKANGSTSEIEVTPNVDTKNSKVSVELKSLNGENSSVSYDLIYDGSSFNYDLPTPNVGFYEAKINFLKLNEETNEYELVESTNLTYSFDYSSEFNFFDETPNTLLNQIASQSGGSILAENNIHIDMSNNQLAESSYVSLMVWILLAAVIIYLVDITIRKSIFRKKEKKEVNQVADNYF